MRETIRLLREERRARPFFAVLAQSSLGTGAAYVALLLLAYERFHSPWAISLILLADFLPSMLLGPLLGAATDRWSRRGCAVVADVIRALAFGGIVLVQSFEATLVLALVAGTGTALFRPAALAGLPSLVRRDRVPAATSVYGALTDFGFTVGPALAGLVLLAAAPETILAANAVTFALSAVVLQRIPFGSLTDQVEARTGATLSEQTREGLRAAAGLPGIRAVLLGSAAAMLFGGLFNVAELPFATDDLGAGDSGYSLLVALFGLGFVAGSLRGSRGGELSQLKRRYLLGLLLGGVGTLAAGLAPSVSVASLGFLLAGFANGMALVHERLIVQAAVAERLHGRIYGVSDTLSSWGFAAGFFAAGAVLSVTSARTLILAEGVGEVLVAALVALALRHHWRARGARDRGVTPPEIARPQTG